jgi:hypothetical protein
MATIPTAAIECPESIARAMAIDAETGTTHWQDAISEELKASKFQLVFYVKPDTLQRKVRLVMDEATPVTTNAIRTGSEVAAEAHLSTKTIAGPKEKFSMHNPAAYVTASVWKSMSKEEQQAARDGRRKLGIKTRNNNLPTTLQLPDFGKPDEVSSKGTTIDLCDVSTPLPVKEKRRTRILTQLELQQEQIMELKRRIQGFQRSNCEGYQWQSSHGATSSYSS